jgi:hypothetical protein
MRLFALVVAAILFVSATLMANSPAGGSRSGSSHSSAGSGGSASTHFSSPSISGNSARSASSSTKAGAKAETQAASPKPGRKSFFALWGRKKPIQPTLASCPISMSRCWKGLGYTTLNSFNSCTALAGQLAQQRRQMEDQNDYGQILRYWVLRHQYDQCLMLSSLPFGSYAYSARLLDTP